MFSYLPVWNLQNKFMKKDGTRGKRYSALQEHVMDAPLRSEEVGDFEDEDYVEDTEVMASRDRSLPSYIKKEKPIIR